MFKKKKSCKDDVRSSKMWSGIRRTLGTEQHLAEYSSGSLKIAAHKTRRMHGEVRIGKPIITTRQTVCTLERLTLGLSLPLLPTGREVPFEEGMITRPIRTTLIIMRDV